MQQATANHASGGTIRGNAAILRVKTIIHIELPTPDTPELIAYAQHLGRSIARHPYAISQPLNNAAQIELVKAALQQGVPTIAATRSFPQAIDHVPVLRYHLDNDHLIIAEHPSPDLFAPSLADHRLSIAPGPPFEFSWDKQPPHLNAQPAPPADAGHADADQPITYWPDQAAIVFRTREIHGGLSSMANGYTIRLGELKFPTVEHIFQACRFPLHQHAQAEIMAQDNPVSARKTAERHAELTRPDWQYVSVDIFYWCNRLKTAQHYDPMQVLFNSTGDLPIVLRTFNDPVWGASARNDGSFVGHNIAGRVMENIRAELREQTRAEFTRPPQPPDITDLTLAGRSAHHIIADERSSYD